MMINFVKPLKLEDCVLHCLGCGSMSQKEDAPQVNLPAKFFKLIVVTKGEGRIYTSDVPSTVRQSDVFLAFPFDSIGIEPVPGSSFEYSYVGFGVNSKKFGDEFNRLWADNTSASKRVFSNESIISIVKSLCSEFEENPKAFSEELVSLLCSQMLVHVVRAFGETGAEKEENSRNFGLCGLVMNYVDTHLYSMNGLSEMAHELGYNYSYLSTMFHKTTNTTLNSYYKTKRMDAARMLISEGNMTISKIAEIMNYSSVYAFSKAFKEYFGVSPSHYLSKNNEK